MLEVRTQEEQFVESGTDAFELFSFTHKDAVKAKIFLLNGEYDPIIACCELP